MDKGLALHNHLTKAVQIIREKIWSGRELPPGFVDDLTGECLSILTEDTPQSIEDHVIGIKRLAKEKYKLKVDVTINYHE